MHEIPDLSSELVDSTGFSLEQILPRRDWNIQHTNKSHLPYNKNHDNTEKHTKKRIDEGIDKSRAFERRQNSMSSLHSREKLDSRTLYRDTDQINNSPHKGQHERSISLDCSDEEQVPYHKVLKAGVYRSEADFEDQIKELKEQSTQKFRTKWEEILYKYSRIDDNKESDEIDLATGKIIVDNGHLQSLHTEEKELGNVKIDGNIWAMNYDLDRDLHQLRKKENKKKEQKHKLKERLKRDKQFHIESWNKGPSPDLLWDHSSRKRIPVEDNLLQLEPSPTKKSKSSSRNGSQSPSPHKSHYYTPTKNKVPSDYYTSGNTSPLQRRNLLHKSYFEESSSILDSAIGSSRLNLKYDAKRGAINSKGRDGFSNDRNSLNSDTSNIDSNSEDAAESETSQTSQIDSNDNEYDSDDTEESNEELHKRAIHYEIVRSSSSDENDDTYEEEEEDFDDQYSVILEPYFLEDTESSTTTTIYNCAFNDCPYCTGNKMLYKNHLLDCHSNELHQVGYPIPGKDGDKDSTKGVSKVANLSRNIFVQFPLTYEIPPLPISEDGQPFVCGKTVDDSTCQRFYLNVGDLIKHQSHQHPNCSSKKQVLMCPLLGCGYITEGGYLEWRAHFIKEKHDVQPQHLNSEAYDTRTHESHSNDTSTSEVEEYISNAYSRLSDKNIIISDDIDDLFSNDGSELENPADIEAENGSDSEAEDDETDKRPSRSHTRKPKAEADESEPEYSSDDVSVIDLTNLPSPPRRSISLITTPKIDSSISVTAAFSPGENGEGYESIEELFSN